MNIQPYWTPEETRAHVLQVLPKDEYERQLFDRLLPTAMEDELEALKEQNETLTERVAELEVELQKVEDTHEEER